MSKKEKKVTVYTEIFKLQAMLDKAKIPYFWNQENEGYQIEYVDEKMKRICSVIQSPISYGNDHDLLEQMGLTGRRNPKAILGNQTAEAVFERILKDYMKRKQLS